MSDNNDQSSDTSSDLNWPLDAAMEGHPHDQVVFENVADQYVKGEDVPAFFFILQDIKINTEEDRIGLLRVGCTNIKECLAYATVQFNPSTTSGSVRHGTAVFPTASLPNTDDEFYQFNYINKGKHLGSSIPFQLNCASDDIDLLSNAPVRKVKFDGLIALADDDNDELVVIHTKQMLTEEKFRQENRHLLDVNRRLEIQRDDCRTKLELFEGKQKEKFSKLINEMQTLIATRKAVIEELSSRQQAEAKLRTEYDACRSLCNQHQSEAAQHAERCRALEENQAKVLHEANQMRNQLAVQSQFTKDQATQIVDLERRLMQADELSKGSTQRQVSLEENQAKVLHEASQMRNQLAVQSQFTKDQATQIVDLERRLMQADELSKTSNRRQALVEQQLRDLQLTSEKHQMSLQGQLGALSKKHLDQINELETANYLLRDELVLLKAENEALSLESKAAQDLQRQLEQRLEQNEQAQRQIEALRAQLDEKKIDTQNYAALKASCAEIGKRCVKHQKSELEAKRQLALCQASNDELQCENKELVERLATGAEEYKLLRRKCIELEHTAQMDQLGTKIETKTTGETILDEDELLDSVLRNSDMDRQGGSDEERQEVSISSAHSSLMDMNAEVKQCPVCSWEFPEQMNVDGKRDHIDNHFD